MMVWKCCHNLTLPCNSSSLSCYCAFVHVCAYILFKTCFGLDRLCSLMRRMLIDWLSSERHFCFVCTFVPLNLFYFGTFVEELETLTTNYRSNSKIEQQSSDDSIYL